MSFTVILLGSSAWAESICWRAESSLVEDMVVDFTGRGMV